MEEVNEQAVVDESAALGVEAAVIDMSEAEKDAAAAQALLDEANAQAARDEEVAAAQAEADQARVDAEVREAERLDAELDAVDTIVEDDEDTSDPTGVHGSVPPTVGLPSDGDGE